MNPIQHPLCPPSFGATPAPRSERLAPPWLAAATLLSLLLLAAAALAALFAPMNETVATSGDVDAADATVVYSPAPGALRELLVREGDLVAERQPVARILIRPEETLVGAEGATPSEVLSPRAGAVVAVTAKDPGERVAVGDALVKIASGAALALNLRATEDRIDRIQPGMTVRFRARSNPDRLAPPGIARVTFVSRDRSLDSAYPQAAPYTIKALVKSSPTPLPLGASVDAEIVLATRNAFDLLLHTR